jgi:hypothetical protein
MTDVQLLFLVLGVIYLWECAFWAGRTSVNIRTWLGKRWRVAPPSVWLGNQRGSIVFAHPFPPLGTLLSSNPWPLSVSPEAVLAYVPPNVHLARRPLQTSAFFRFEDIQSIEARGKKVWVNGQLLLKTASPTFASYIADTLQSIRRAKAPERARLLEKLAERGFDTKVVEKLSEQFQQSSARLRLTANFLFVYLFAIAPFVIWLFGLSGTWPWLLGGTLVCTIVITVLFIALTSAFLLQQRMSDLLIPSLSSCRPRARCVCSTSWPVLCSRPYIRWPPSASFVPTTLLWAWRGIFCKNYVFPPCPCARGRITSPRRPSRLREPCPSGPSRLSCAGTSSTPKLSSNLPSLRTRVPGLFAHVAMHSLRCPPAHVPTVAGCHWSPSQLPHLDPDPPSIGFSATRHLTLPRRLADYGT